MNNHRQGMMECEQASELMSARLDGRLDAADAARLEEHLAGCGLCQAEWARFQLLDRLFVTAAMARPPLHLRGQLMARLERREQARRMVVGSASLALGTFALALLVLAPLFLNLVTVIGAAPALLSGGPATLSQIWTFVCTWGRALGLVLENLVAPLAAMGLLGLLMVIALRRLWMGTLGRARTAM